MHINLKLIGNLDELYQHASRELNLLCQHSQTNANGMGEEEGKEEEEEHEEEEEEGWDGGGRREEGGGGIKIDVDDVDDFKIWETLFIFSTTN